MTFCIHVIVGKNFLKKWKGKNSPSNYQNKSLSQMKNQFSSFSLHCLYVLHLTQETYDKSFSSYDTSGAQLVGALDWRHVYSNSNPLNVRDTDNNCSICEGSAVSYVLFSWQRPLEGWFEKSARPIPKMNEKKYRDILQLTLFSYKWL